MSDIAIRAGIMSGHSLLEVECATCGQPVSERCVNQDGTLAMTHTARIDLFFERNPDVKREDRGLDPIPQVHAEVQAKVVFPDWDAFHRDVCQSIERNNIPVHSVAIKDSISWLFGNMSLPPLPGTARLENTDIYRRQAELWAQRKAEGRPIMDFTNPDLIHPKRVQVDVHKKTSSRPRSTAPPVTVQKDWIITVLKPHGKNPNGRKPMDGSLSRFDRCELYGAVGNKIKVDDWVAAGGKLDDLKWDQRDGIINVEQE